MWQGCSFSGRKVQSSSRKAHSKRRKVHSGRRKVLSVRAKWTQGEPHFRGLGLPLQRGDAGGGWRMFTFYCPRKVPFLAHAKSKRQYEGSMIGGWGVFGAWPCCAEVHVAPPTSSQQT